MVATCAPGGRVRLTWELQGARETQRVQTTSIGGEWGGDGGSVEVGECASDTRGATPCRVHTLRAALFATTLAGAGQCVTSASAEALFC
eukprot:1503419-Pyramimonas_sp.AAC.1